MQARYMRSGINVLTASHNIAHVCMSAWVGVSFMCMALSHNQHRAYVCVHHTTSRIRVWLVYPAFVWLFHMCVVGVSFMCMALSHNLICCPYKPLRNLSSRVALVDSTMEIDPSLPSRTHKRRVMYAPHQPIHHLPHLPNALLWPL